MRSLLIRGVKLRSLMPLLTATALIVCTLIISIRPVAAIGGQEKVAYYGNWDIYGNNYFLKNVDRTGAASQLTTLVYSFENISPTTLQCFQDSHPVDVSESNPNGGDGGGDAWGDFQRPFPASESVNGQADNPTQPLRGSMNQLKELKARHPNLKVILSIGGWTFSKYFSDAAATPASRQALVSSCVDMYIRGNLPTGVQGDLTSGGQGVAKGIFDGIDIDWEFPADSTGHNTGHLGNHASPNDGANYVSLLGEFRSQLNAQGSADGGKHYYLTAAVESGGNAESLRRAPQFLPYLDWAGVMTYDMHGAWENLGPTNHQSAIFPALTDPKAPEHLSTDESLTRWKNAGWPASKLVVGVPFYWRGWSGVPNTNGGLYQTATGPSPAFPITNQPGVANYKEMLKAGKTKNPHFDTVAQSSTIYDNGNFYTGDMPDSLIKKGAYIRGNGYLGAMIYSLEGDDPSGTLMKSVYKGLNGGATTPVPSIVSVIAAARTAVSSPNTATNGEPINMIGGNFLATRHELKLPNKDNPVDFALNYNSATADQSNTNGWGWNNTYHITAMADVDGSVVVQNPDGRMDRFTPNGSGGFIAPSGILDTLTFTNNQYKVTHKDRSIYNFNTKGQIASIVSANGNVQTLTYDSNDMLTTITDSANRSLTLAYNDVAQLATVTDPSGRVVTYTYDATGNLVSVKNPANQTTTYAYDDNHHITKLTDPRGNDVVVNVYDDQGRVTQQTNGLNNTVMLAYAAGQTTYTDANGGVTIYYSDSQMRLTKVHDATGGDTITSYDAAGNVYQTTDPLGHTTTRLYDTRGNLTQVTDAAVGVQSFTYDSSDNLLTRTDQLNHTTTYAYDANGNVTQKTDPAGNITHFTYSVNGQSTAVTDPLNNLTGFVYDASGNQVTKTDASNRNTYYGYDNIGRLTAVENADLQETDYTLDPMDRVTKITNPSGGITTFAYDGDGNKTTSTDANNHATNYQYDANNNLTKTTNALNQATNYVYDKNDNLTKVTDAKAHDKVYAYDLLNRQTQSTDPLGNITKATYDAAGNLASNIDASNRTTTYTYNVLNQLIKVTYPDATLMTYTYNAVGNVLTATNSAGTTTYTYDNLDRLATVKDPHNALLTYTYNAADELTQVKYPDNKIVSYTYTPAKQLSTTKDWNNATTTYLYDNEGRVAVKTLPNTIKGTYTYDSNGNLTDLVYKKGTASLTRFSYEHDAVGNITTDTETKANGSQLYSEYTYDALNQVTMDDAPAHTWNYTYDAVGNMATQVADGTTTNYTYNNANRLTSKGTRAFTYDNQGNEITDAAKTLAYNFDNQLKTYTSGSTTTNYVYDASGNRTDKTQTGTGATNYQYVNAGNNQVMVTKNLTSGTSNFNVYGNDLISQGDTASTARQYYLTDGLGNVKYLTNSTGTTLNTYSYDPWGGNQTTSGSTANNYVYQAEQKDVESSLVYLRARYYDPSIGRFTSADPSKGTLDNSGSQNGYNYTENNPGNRMDPLGLWYVNIGVGIGIPITTKIGKVPTSIQLGVQFNTDGLWVSKSVGGAGAGLGWSATVAPGAPSPGNNIGGSAFYGVGGAVSYANGTSAPEFGIGTKGVFIGVTNTSKNLACSM